MPEAKVLLFDIETAPNLAAIWGKYEQNAVWFEQEWYILSFAWKWLGESETHVLGLDDFGLYRDDPADDHALCQKLHSLLCEADIVIAHNGDKFDLRKANTRFLIHGFGPPSPFRKIDTLKVARKYFMLNSNKLGDLAQALGLGGKAESGGYETWRGCMMRDPEAWDRMKHYNKVDVFQLERVYLRLRPFIENHPNMSLISERPDACPKCESDAGMIFRKNRHNATTTVKVFQCKACGGYSPGRLSESDVPKPKYK